MIITLNKYDILSSGSILIPDSDSFVTFSEDILTFNVRFEENVKQDCKKEEIIPFFKYGEIDENKKNTLDIIFCNLKSSEIISYYAGPIEVGTLKNKKLFFIMSFNITGAGREIEAKRITMNYSWLTSK